MKLDLHLHTEYSFDSNMKIKDIIKVAKNRGLSGIAISDHNSIDGIEEAEELAGPGFFIIPGMEVHTTWGDILCLFCHRFIESRVPKMVVEEIHNYGGIAVWPHPRRMKMKAPDEIIHKFDAVETFNARAARTDKIERSQGELDLRNLALTLNKPITGGSDAHTLNEIGNGRTIVPDSCKSVSDIKKAILSGKSMVEGEKSTFWTKFSSKFKVIDKNFSDKDEENDD